MTKKPGDERELFTVSYERRQVPDGPACVVAVARNPSGEPVGVLGTLSAGRADEDPALYREWCDLMGRFFTGFLARQGFDVATTYLMKGCEDN